MMPIILDRTHNGHCIGMEIIKRDTGSRDKEK